MSRSSLRIAAVVGSLFGVLAAPGPWTITGAAALAIGCMAGADAVQNAAILSDERRKREAEAEITCDDAMVAAFEKAAAIVWAAEAEAKERMRPFVELLERQREQEAEAGRGI